MFVVLVLSATILGDRGERFWLGLLDVLADLDGAGQYDWAGSAYAHLFSQLRGATRIMDAPDATSVVKVSSGWILRVVEVLIRVSLNLIALVAAGH